MLKTITILLSITTTYSQDFNIPGSQTDDHNCVLDGGYTWCESTQKCHREWEEECPQEVLSSFHDSEFCPHSNIQMCRMSCDTPLCENDECAVRVGDCCSYTCEINTESCEVCPPNPPCPEAPSSCEYTPPIPDNCGCINSCGIIDCSNSISIEGETCGGYMPRGMSRNCIDGLECIQNSGIMIPDSPGTCQKPCETIRDTHGNCVSNKVTNIPWNCLTWYDGCNTCSVNNGNIGGCTMMMCFTTTEPYCMTYTMGELQVGDICQRFCEDGSQTSISRINDCPKNTQCIPYNPNTISFDTCSINAMLCLPINGH